jgi:hypothetical protein
LTATLQAGAERREEEQVAVPGALRGTYVEFDSIPGLALELERLDSNRRVAPKLVSVRTDFEGDEAINRAVVWIPDGGHSAFVRRFTQYAETTTADKPRNRDLVERIDAIRLATLRSLWTDTVTQFPGEGEVAWWELWLRRRDDDVWARLQAFTEGANIVLSTRRLAFQDRLVTMCQGTSQQLARGLDSLDDLAELRKPRPLSQWLPTLFTPEQLQLANELAGRSLAASPDAPAVAVLDTGVHRAHPLLAPSLQPQDGHRINTAWRLDDEIGHGTEMGGLALYGDLSAAITSGIPVSLTHRLESVRILPPALLQNPPELYAAITAQAVSLLEIAAPNRPRVIMLAVTASSEAEPIVHARTVGQPTSWSAAVDALAVGLGVAGTADNLVFLRDDPPTFRLFVISAGNVREDQWSTDHLTRSDLAIVEEPAQSWNALTVGAYTTLTAVTDPTYAGWQAIAPAGELSPLSRTSVSFNRAWPVKPDIVLEGGNVAASPAETDFGTPPELRLLTTHTLAAVNRPFSTANATSAAAAQAAYLAADIQASDPTLWPETVRALVVHSAEWTEPMRAHFDAATSRTEANSMRRRYGMGVPSLERALRSATDAVTLIVEDVIHPFEGGNMREMRVHELPWPVHELAALGETAVRLRVTLSYFIEPNPGRRGWVQRYAYASHGLRFDLRRATESLEQFRKRLNLKARGENIPGAPKPARSMETGRWVFGPDLRTVGSLHTDIWYGTAADLAARGVLAVYPVAGWWKERSELDRSEAGARYSLVVSIEAPEVEVDLWTPVAIAIGIPIEIATE